MVPQAFNKIQINQPNNFVFSLRAGLVREFIGAGDGTRTRTL